MQINKKPQKTSDLKKEKIKNIINQNKKIMEYIDNDIKSIHLKIKILEKQLKELK